ncbi:hypothetical protein RA275_28070, partial [Pseudomonas syringae pv. tagetis]
HAEVRASEITPMVVVVMVFILLQGLLIRVLMRALQQMGRGMRDIDDGAGALTERLAITAQDEFGARAIDQGASTKIMIMVLPPKGTE